MNADGSSVARIKAQARYSGLILRHTVYFLCSVIYLVQPNHTAIGWVVVGFTAVWSAYRLLRRRVGSGIELAVDYSVVVVVALTLQYTLGGLDFSTTNPYALALVGTSVIGFTMALRLYQSALTTLGLMVSFAIGATGLPEVTSPFTVYWVYYFVLQWSFVYFMRWLVVRSARIADEAAASYEAAELTGSVARARRVSQREHWATLHDTAAATLMMVGQGVPVRPARLKARATRDLHALRTLPSWLSEAGDYDLLDALRKVVRESAVRVEVTARTTPSVPAAVTAALVGAVREALGNVERHSGVMSAELVIDEGIVTLSDEGRGFDPDAATTSDTAGYGRGMRESISGRMDRVGGSAVVASQPGGGTRVQLRWDQAQQSTGDVMDPARRAERINRGFSTGLIAVAIIFTSVTAMHAGGIEFFRDTTQLGLLGVLVLITAVGGYGVVVRPLPTWLTIACGLGVCVVSFVQPLTISTPIGEVEHWTAGCEGWVTLLLVVNQPALRIASVLAVSWLPNIAAALVLGQLFTLQMQSLSNTAVTNLVVQIIMGTFVVEMRRHAGQAAEAAYSSAGVIEAQAIASELQRDHQLRYATLAVTTIPLLESFADGRTTAASPGAREAAALESSRLRRLFEELDADAHPLVLELNEVLADAERRGLSVSIDVDTDLRELSDADRDALSFVPRRMLATAESYARIVVTDDDVVQISVIADSPDSTRTDLARSPVSIEVRSDRDGDTLWAQASLLQADRMAVRSPRLRWSRRRARASTVDRSGDSVAPSQVEESTR